MIGESELKVTEGTMIEAVQLYLESKLVNKLEAPRVQSVYQDVKGRFVIELLSRPYDPV